MTLAGSNPIALIRSRQAMPAAPSAVADEPRVPDVAPGQMHGVDHASGRDDRGAMLIVMKDGNVHHLAQALLDVEARRRLDVLEIDSRRTTAQDI